MKFNTMPRIFLEEYDIPNPPVPSLLVKDEVLLTVSCPIFPSILIAKRIFPPAGVWAQSPH
jgi:hypothetical protein